jgi:hypothetical protein
MHWALAVLLLITACQSKPAKKGPSRGPAGDPEKVTKAPAQLKKEVFVLVEYAPRRPEEVELGVLNSGMKACLLAFFNENKAPSFVTFEGKIDYRGELQDLEFEGPEQSLVNCLKTSSNTVRLGRGKTGPFKMSLATGPDLLRGAKSLLISPPELKKFE